MNNIQKVIEESLKEFEEKFTSVWSSKHSELIRIPDGIKGNIKSHISATITNVLTAIEKEVKGKKKDGTSLYGQVTGEPMQYNQALSDIQALLKSAKEQNSNVTIENPATGEPEELDMSCHCGCDCNIECRFHD